MNVLLVVDNVFNHYDNMKALLEKQVEELTTHKDIMKLSPDFDSYKHLADRDLIYGVYAYLDGDLIGYSLNILSNHMHYADLICAVNDILFVDKNYRKSGIGKKIMDKSEEEAKNRGAGVFLQKAKPNTPLYNLLDKAEDYSVQEITFLKVL